MEKKGTGPMQSNYIPVERNWNVGMDLCGIQIKECRNGQIIGRNVHRSNYWSQGAKVKLLVARCSGKIIDCKVQRSYWQPFQTKFIQQCGTENKFRIIYTH